MTGTGSIGHGGPYFFFLLLFFFNIYLFIIIFYRPWLGLHAEILGPHLSKLIKLIPGSFQSDPEIIELGLFQPVTICHSGITLSSSAFLSLSLVTVPCSTQQLQKLGIISIVQYFIYPSEKTISIAILFIHILVNIYVIIYALKYDF